MPRKLCTKTRRVPSLIPLLLMSLMAFVPAASASEGEAWAQRVYERADGDDVVIRGRMILMEESQEPRVRETYEYRLDVADGEVRNLVRFTRPGDIADTGLLTHDHADGESDQWLYLPALDRVRRISSERRGGRFVGSDLYYEDLEDRKVDRERHTVTGREDIHGVETIVLESVVVEGDPSVYSRRIRWVHPETLVALRTDYFEGAEEPSKRMTVHRLEKIQDYWTVMDSTMEDLESGHQTRLVVDDIIYDQGLPETLFSTDVLSDVTRERQYRPAQNQP